MVSSTHSMHAVRGGGNDEPPVAWRDAVRSGVGVLLGFQVLALLQEKVLPLIQVGCDANGRCVSISMLCPPLGALAAILFCAPDSPAAQPRSVVLGHIVGGTVAVAVWSCFALAFREGIAGKASMIPGIAVALTIAAQRILGCVHPPGAAYAFMVASQGVFWVPGRGMTPVPLSPRGVWSTANLQRLCFPGLLGAVCLLGTQRIYFWVIRSRELHPGFIRWTGTLN